MLSSKPKIEPEDLPDGICGDCGAGCRGELQDHGIGSYEYWGARGTHHEWVVCSPCCGAEVVEGGEVVKSRKTHVARRDHKDGKVKKGDKYLKIVYHRWRKDGPGWYVTEKRVLERAEVAA